MVIHTMTLRYTNIAITIAEGIITSRLGTDAALGGFDRGTPTINSLRLGLNETTGFVHEAGIHLPDHSFV